MDARGVLILAAEPTLRKHLLSVVSGAGYDTVAVPSLEGALTALRQCRFLLTMVQRTIEGHTLEEILAALRAEGGRAGAVVLVADDGASPSSRDALPVGAEHVLSRPWDAGVVEQAVRDLLAVPVRPADADDEDQILRCRREMALWRSPRMAEVQDIIQRAAEADVTVLITGDTGTGKDLVARAIHYSSLRQHRPYVKVNCAAVPRDLLESELFGHERGAFTGAHQLQLGKFETANRGTIFLDEIGDLHPALQGKLLHVLQDGAFSRVGGKSAITVDVRVLAATNQDLERAVASGRFREDLYYRLNVIQIAVPPLRDRREEIPVLADYFIRRYAKMFRRDRFTIPATAMDRLLHHSYPGNVRELENLIKRMIVLSDPTLTRAFGAPNGASPIKQTAGPRPEPKAISLKDVSRNASRTAEREAMMMMLDSTGWNRVKAAHLLGISYRGLLYKMKQAGLKRVRHATSAIAGGAV